MHAKNALPSKTLLSLSRTYGRIKKAKEGEKQRGAIKGPAAAQRQLLGRPTTEEKEEEEQEEKGKREREGQLYKRRGARRDARVSALRLFTNILAAAGRGARVALEP